MRSTRVKKVVVLSMACVLTLQSPFLNLSVKAEKVNNYTEETTEYVIQVESEKELEELTEDNENAVVEEESVEELEQENIVVMELTAEEVAELEEEKDIIIEENILFETSTMEEVELATEEVTEATEEITEELTEETTETSVESVTETTQDSTVVEKESPEPENKPNDKEDKPGKKEKKNKEDKSGKEEKKDKENKPGKKEKKDKEDKKDKEAGRELIKKKMEKCSNEDEQWNLDAIHYPESVNGSAVIKVAVLDSGVSFDEDITVSGRVTINEKNEVENDLFDDATGHGTSMAGIIAAQDNDEGIKGMNPNAEVYSIQIFDENNQSTLGQVIAGIQKAIELDCDIINMSFGTTVDSKLLHEAIREAHKNGILMVAAAGNTQNGKVEYPAAYEEVLAVGATDTTGNKLEGTSDGKEIEIFAPGDQIVSTGLFGGSIVVSGTSIATAQVSGAASLLWSMDKSKDAGFIRSLMTNTAQTMDTNGKSEGGLLDIENAIAHYGDLEYTYEEDCYEYEELQEEVREAEEFLDVKLVNGMWSGAKHDSMASNAAAGYIKNEYIRIMAQAARDADDYKKNHLHAGGNYVKTLKFLYQCAWYLREGDDTQTAVNKANAETGLSKVDEQPDGKGKGQQTINAVYALLAGDAGANKKVRYYKVLGFAMHVVGDTYAHRTIVPKYTVKGTNPTYTKFSTNETSEDARFGTYYFGAAHKKESKIEAHRKHWKDWAKDSYELNQNNEVCHSWTCFQETVKLGVMEFKDIKNYVEKTTSDYEDHSSFCRERYEDAQLCCDALFTDFYEKCAFDGVYILFPTEKNVKLNNLKKFAEKEGQDTSYFSAQEWNEMSTPEAY